MEFLKNNARGIIISLIVAGAIIGIASLSGDDTNTESNTTQETTTQNEESQEANTGDAENSEASENAGEESNTDQENQDSEDNNEEQATVDSNDEGFASTTVTGDNQTVVVRRIVDRYLSSSETELSAEQMLYVETNLVNDIGRSDFVAVGEEISLAESTVAQRVEEAQNLSEAAIARWAQYL